MTKHYAPKDLTWLKREDVSKSDFFDGGWKRWYIVCFSSYLDGLFIFCSVGKATIASTVIPNVLPLPYLHSMQIQAS